jgi:hypothetical protein
VGICRRGKECQQKTQGGLRPIRYTLEGSNVEAARVALRSLIGTIPVFKDAGKLYGRTGVDPMPLYRRNPSTFGVMVAGGRYELYSNYPLQIQAVAASVATTA